MRSSNSYNASFIFSYPYSSYKCSFLKPSFSSLDAVFTCTFLGTFCLNPRFRSNVEQNPDILEKLTSAYNQYAKDVGVIIPRAQAYYDSVESASRPVNQSQVTISSADIIPEKFSSEAPIS